MRIQIVSIYLDCIFECIGLFFTAMERSYIPMIIEIFILPMHIFWCQFFVVTMGHGFIGVAYAAITTDVVAISIVFIMMRFIKDRELKEAWVPFSREIFVELKQFIRIAFAGLMIYCFQQWSSEGLYFMSGWIGQKDLAAVVIVFSIMAIIYFIPASLSLSISALVGQFLGSDKVDKAITTIKIAYTLGAILIACLFFVLQSFAVEISQIFTTNEEI